LTSIGTTYADSIASLIERNKLLESMSDQIAANLPVIDEKVLNDQYTRPEQHFAFVDILVSSLRAGLTNVATLTLDDLSTPYDGLLEHTIKLHEVGHNKDLKGIPPWRCERPWTHHTHVIDRLVTKLKESPEGQGTMFDNTLILYLSENGETHHSLGTEVPFVVLAGQNVKLNMARRRYLRLPNYNEEGHKTLGN